MTIQYKSSAEPRFPRKIREWHGSVYKAGSSQSGIPRELRKAVLKRDRHRCQMCDGKRNLEIHHIMPRAEGGSDDMVNLITLCRRCHDIAEIEELRNRTLIENWLHEPIEQEPEDDDPPPDWHAWVYGGYRRPR